MSADTLLSEIDFVFRNRGVSPSVGVAAIADFLRDLHEIMTKARRDQLDVLSQVQTVFGATPMHHLASLLDAELPKVKSYVTPGTSPLHRKVDQLCRERGLEVADGRHLLAHFLKALDEARVDADKMTHSPAVMTYWAIGPEAAYHLCGLYVGDNLTEVSTELHGYLDTHLHRFSKLVEIWEMERAWAEDDAK